MLNVVGSSNCENLHNKKNYMNFNVSTTKLIYLEKMIKITTFSYNYSFKVIVSHRKVHDG